MSWNQRFTQEWKRLKLIGWSQERLAAELGVHQATVSKWLKGKQKPQTLEQFEKLATILGVHPVFLMYGIDPKKIIEEEDAVMFAREWMTLPPAERAAMKTAVHAIAEQQRLRKTEHHSEDGSPLQKTG